MHFSIMCGTFVFLPTNVQVHHWMNSEGTIIERYFSITMASLKYATMIKCLWYISYTNDLDYQYNLNI